ncbi:alpha-tocopherol transfer protein-like [Ptychodera flava]|uniref:alpha-tocopherol transfer protein-like n=1 Tax=Ptychodera flava TaxID=63121 RepID=UPI00396A64B9
MSDPKGYQSSLSHELLEKAKKELNEDPSKTEQKLHDLRQMFKKRPDIKFRTDDTFLLRYLRVRKFNVERAYKTLVHYYEVRDQFKELYADYTPSDVVQQLKDQIHWILRSRDKDGRRVFIVRPGNWDLEKYSITPCLKTAMMLMELICEEEETQINGVVVIADYSGMSMKHVKQLNPIVVRKLADTIQNALPLRLKAIHYVNQPKIFDIIFGLFKPFFSEKMLKRLHFHGDEYGTLHEHIPSSILPAEYGGALQNMTNQEWADKLFSQEDAIIENNKYGFPKSSEVLGAQKQGEDAAGGLVGSFKKLDI